MTYADFFRRATSYAPFPYQERVAVAAQLPTMLEAPTGAGKTAAIILGWLWHRRFRGDALTARTPRRLVYCLPMRVLVDQVRGEAERWIERLALDVGVHALRGGAIDEAWEGTPDRDTIIVGTQDQLLSRALNRGYAMSRFRWAVPFGLLNNDAWWVLDEVQLMGPGLRTAAQLDGMRSAFGAFGPVGTTFMSATIQPEWLEVPDAPGGLEDGHLALEPQDWSQPSLAQRTTASKPLSKAPESDAKQLAPWIAQQHAPGTLTLVVVNRVARAQELARRLRSELPDAELVLIHSRFRPAERAANEARLQDELPPGGRVVVATQTIEAGVDLDAHRLVTDLAPWPSLVQRFGRCNRRGERERGDIFWVDLDETKKSNAAPYDPALLAEARGRLESLSNARIDELPKGEHPWLPTDVPRRRDVLGLFDTDPDLDGNFVDISRWVRGEGGADVQVYWRAIDDAPHLGDAAPHPNELCSVALDAFRDFVKKLPTPRRVWQWDTFEGRWNRAHLIASGSAPGFISAGQTYLIDGRVGGYDPQLGWTAKANQATPPVSDVGEALEAYSRDPRSEAGYVALDVHLADAAREATRLVEAIGILGPDLAAHVTEAAGWHDAGKAHPVFQTAARRLDGPLLAKAPSFERYGTRGFRHELVSALLAVRAARPDLVAYLVAAHHGKVRVSLRPLQWQELEPEGQLRGVRATDAVPSVDTPTGPTPEAPPLPLGVAALGRGDHGASWTDRVVRLLEELGPFRLAYLEALVRIADWRASEQPSSRLEEVRHA
ncbi:MAG: CRISPR-associated endonuclease Cas3'' [Myxococcales bacterium]|nr:CRISPR-associated endonuclease Cas3'' [Myxococcales bacterium]